jgi:hypothetical protein
MRPYLRWNPAARIGDALLDPSSPTTPVVEIASFERHTQCIHRRGGIVDRTPRLVVAPDLLCVDVDVNDAGESGNQAPAVGAVLVCPRAHEQDRIGFVQRRMPSERTWPVERTRTPHDNRLVSSTRSFLVLVVRTGR